MSHKASQKVFVPLTDELLYEHPELITAPLRPFHAGQPCFHWLEDAEIEIIPPPERAANAAPPPHTGSRLA